MRISDWSSDVCSSVLEVEDRRSPGQQALDLVVGLDALAPCLQLVGTEELLTGGGGGGVLGWRTLGLGGGAAPGPQQRGGRERSEEHTSELQSLMRISYAVFCLKKKKNTKRKTRRIGR